MLSVKQAADRLGVSAQTVYGLCAAGQLRHSRVGVGRGVIRIAEEARAEYLRGRESGPPASVPPPAARAKVKFEHLRP